MSSSFPQGKGEKKSFLGQSPELGQGRSESSSVGAQEEVVERIGWAQVRSRLCGLQKDKPCLGLSSEEELQQEGREQSEETAQCTRISRR